MRNKILIKFDLMGTKTRELYFPNDFEPFIKKNLKKKLLGKEKISQEKY